MQHRVTPLLYVPGKMEPNNLFRLDGTTATVSLKAEGISLDCFVRADMQQDLPLMLVMTFLIVLLVTMLA